jgi:hypothetical protein
MDMDRADGLRDLSGSAAVVARDAGGAGVENADPPRPDGHAERGEDAFDVRDDYADMLRDGRSAYVFSVTGFRNRALDRAAANPGRGPASGGDSLWTKLFCVLSVVVVVFASPDPASCDKLLRPWLLSFAAGLASYVGTVRCLYWLLRPRRRELQEVLAYALYVVSFPLSLAWLIVGAVLVFKNKSGDEDCARGSIIRVASIIVCVVSLLYIGFVFVFVVCATAVSCWLAPASTARGLSNVLRNRMPNAASASALRALKSTVYDPDDKEGCGLAGLTDTTCSICLEPYRMGDNVIGLPCEPSVPHVFHNSCIQLWFSRSTSCPLCKRDI